MKKTLLLLAVFVPVALAAQNTPDSLQKWKISGVTSLTLNQASFSNWTSGGENSVAVSALGKLFADYTHGNFSNNNALTLKYGMLKKESDDHARKSEDLIELISQFNQKFSKDWSATGQLNFNTQFANGYTYPDDSTVVSKFMSPAYLTIAPGLLYKPVEYFSILMTPITARTIFVLDQDLADVGAYGVDAATYDSIDGVRVKTDDGKNVKLKLGAFVEFYFKKEIKTDLTLESRLNLFYNYLQDDNLPDDKLPLDLNWQTFFNYKLNKWFSANLFVHVAYMPGDVFIDRDVLSGKNKPLPNEKLQLLQTFGLGFAYNF
ncbi:MAG: DUF3078 domain-containing protein [Bacteroidales bacterium]|nr:DUF3078 domain-containing protein [Bacteroidales bacterium]